MSAYRNYPEGYEPSAGPFKVVVDDDRHLIAEICHSYSDELVLSIKNRMLMSAVVSIPPAQARELAAALIECADYIDRANMTAEDIARETRNRT